METQILQSPTSPSKKEIASLLESGTAFHFHDTGVTAQVKRRHNINDNELLREDASNLAAFLYRLKEEHLEHYQSIVGIIKRVAPYFGDFNLRPIPNSENQTQLEWVEKNSDFPCIANDFSDGTLRFICLATLLLSPKDLIPPIIVIDEPELGLHPFALVLLAELIKNSSLQHQIIISTQSAFLIDQFEPEDLIVVDRKDQQSVFSRLNKKDLGEWLEEYSLGELWEKNILGGRIHP